MIVVVKHSRVIAVGQGIIKGVVNFGILSHTDLGVACVN